MRPKERRDSGQNDCFKARLDQIIDMDHALAKRGRAIDWALPRGALRRGLFRQGRRSAAANAADGGLSILKHMHDLSDEDLCAPWVENPYYQLFWLGPI